MHRLLAALLILAIPAAASAQAPAGGEFRAQLPILFVLLIAISPAPTPSPVVPLKELPLKYATPLDQVADLSIAVQTKGHVVAEPIRITLTITNVEDRDFVCYCNLHPGEIDLEYRRLPDGLFHKLRTSERTRYPHVTRIQRVPPGGTVKGSLLVAYDFGRRAVPFDSPGQYEIRVSFFDRARRIESRLLSKPLLIDVVPSHHSESLAAYTEAVAEMVQDEGFENVSDQTVLAAGRLLELYPESAYAGRELRIALRGQLLGRIFRNDGGLRDDVNPEFHRLFDLLRVMGGVDHTE